MNAVGLFAVLQYARLHNQIMTSRSSSPFAFEGLILRTPRMKTSSIDTYFRVRWHGAADLGLQSTTVYTDHCLCQQILDFLCCLGWVHCARLGTRSIPAVLPPTDTPQLSCPLRISVKCAETPLHCHKPKPGRRRWGSTPPLSGDGPHKWRG
jgi:hypothetical protein